MSMGDSSVATGGLFNCKAKVQFGMLSSEMYKESTEIFNNGRLCGSARSRTRFSSRNTAARSLWPRL